MNVRKESQHEAYDAVVIGSGMGGIGAAAVLAYGGRRVLVVERHDRAGGFAHGFTRRKYRFDSAVHITSGCNPVGHGQGAIIHRLLELLGTRDQCTFVPVDPFYQAVFPGLSLEIPTGVQEFVDRHIDAFPHERQGIKKFMRLCTRVFHEVRKIPPEPPPAGARALADLLPLHYEYRNATVADVMDQFLDDDRLKAVLSSLWPYLGLPPTRAAFVFWAPMVLSTIGLGVFYSEGGFQRMVDAVVTGIERLGGEVMTRTPVRRILTAGGQVTGVQLENGQRIAAPLVISNADARQTFEELVPSDELPADFLVRLRRLRPALSAATLFLATDMDLRSVDGAQHEMFVFDHWSHDETYRRILAGEPTGLSITIPSLADPTVAPDGDHLVTVTTLVPYDMGESWRERKACLEKDLLDGAERVLPGITDSLKFAEGATPRTMERYTLNYMGSIYGWEQTPDQAGASRLGRRTPVGGLYLAGHWTQPGGGVLPSLVSGIQTAQLALGEEGDALVAELVGTGPLGYVEHSTSRAQ